MRNHLILAVTLLAPAALVSPDPCWAAPAEEGSNNNLLCQNPPTPVLKGGVSGSSFEGRIFQPAHLKMSKAEFAAAVKQYDQDLARFCLDAKRYAANLAQYNIEVGDCNQKENKFKAELRQDQLNISAVKVPTISLKIQSVPTSVAPPLQNCHVCHRDCATLGCCRGGGGANARQTSSVRTQSGDAQRLATVQAELDRQNAQLKLAEKEGRFSGQDATNQARLAGAREGLANQFGQLKAQYQLLKVERDTLTGTTQARQ